MGNEIIEIDESKIGKRKYNKGHLLEGVWIFGMVERVFKRKILLFRVDDRTKSILRLHLSRCVIRNSMKYGDCWKGNQLTLDWC